MVTLDTNAYRKNVLARLLNEPGLADPQTGDPFLVCAVDPDADDATAARQFDEVVAFWNKERNHPRYRGLAAQLVGRKAEYESILLNTGARKAAAQRVTQARESAQADGIAVLDDLARRLGSIPRSKMDALKRIADHHGLDAVTFTSWSARQRVVEDTDAVPWDDAVRRQIRRSLDELATLEHHRPGFPTLYSLLGLENDAPVARIRQAADELNQINAGARRDRRKTLLGDLLATIKTRLLAADGPERYKASLKADARDLIRPEIEMLAVVTGEISAEDHQTLLTALVGNDWGLSMADAREIIRQVAAQSGAALSVAVHTRDIIVCGLCERPQTETAPDCRYCGTALHLTCPSCGQQQPSAAMRCSNCGTSLAAYRRTYNAIREAQELPPTEAETELTKLLATAPDARIVRDALNRLPLAPPTAVTALAEADAVRVQWQPSASTGAVAYRLARQITAAGSEGTRGLGRTTSTSFEDAGAPGGLPLRYQVMAVAGDRSSVPVHSDEVLVAREIEGLSARTVRVDGAPAVQISYRDPGGAGLVAVERLGDAVTPIKAGAGVATDTSVRPGDTVTYRARVTYRGSGEPIATEGRTVEVTVDALPVPVPEIWFSPQTDGSVRLSFDHPPAGQVSIYATTGPTATPIAAWGTDVDPRAIRQQARLVGTGTRRIIDRAATGRVIYTPVTVVGDLAVAGNSRTVIAAPPVTGLSGRDQGNQVVVNFIMPAGVTEAAVRWRRDQFPESADDPAATGENITNTKLEIAGGLTIPAPNDGRPLFIAVYPTVRLSTTGRPVPASVSTTLVLRGSH